MTTTPSGAELKAGRTLLGLSQKQVADALHISVDSLWRAERGLPGSQRTQHQLRGLLMRNGIVFSPNGVRRSDDAGQEYRAWLQRWR